MRHWRITGITSQEVSTSDCIKRQPKMAMWSPKPEIVIPRELQQIASKVQRQVQIKCRQVIATMTDNRKWQCGRQTGSTYISVTTTDRMTVSTQIWGFRPRPARINWPWAIVTTNDKRKSQHRTFCSPKYRFVVSPRVIKFKLNFLR